MNQDIPKDKLPDVLKHLITKRIDNEVEEILEEAKKELERRTPEIVSSVSVGIMKMVDMESFGDRIVFSIRKETEE